MRADVQEWLELQGKEVSLTLKVSEVRAVETALSRIIFDYMTNEDISHSDKMCAVEYFQGLRSKFVGA
jgi:hypothetical protein